MHQHFCIGVLLLEFSQLERFKFVVNDARALPQQHVGTGFALDVRAQVTIRCPDNFLTLAMQMFNDAQADRGSDHPIGTRLYCRTGVGVHDDGAIRMRIAIRRKLIRWATEIERTFGFEFGHDHALFGIQNLCRFAHESYAAHHHRFRRMIATEACHLQ